jgi:hypothetical protein
MKAVQRDDSVSEGGVLDNHPEAVARLFGASQALLSRGPQLDALLVLHRGIARSLAPAELASLPVRYSSLAEAAIHHQRLLAVWRRQVPASSPVEKLRELWHQKPRWSARAAVAAIGLLLMVRYTWLVIAGKNWAQQNPEGNWISRFYGNERFEGFPLVRYDVGVNSDFGPRSPADSMKRDKFSARWDTCIAATKESAVSATLRSDDSSQLFLDEQPQFAVIPGPGQASATLMLSPGLHQLRVDFVEQRGTAMVRLDGFEPDGTEAYSFRRPVFEGDQPRCR